MREPHPPNHVTHWSRGNEANQKRYISTFIKLMAPKLGKVLTQDEVTPHKTWRDTSTLHSHGNSETSVSFSSILVILRLLEVCAERNWLIQVLAYFYPSLSKKYTISNVKQAVDMQRKACADQKETQKCQLVLRVLRWTRSWLIQKFICITASANPEALK